MASNKLKNIVISGLATYILSSCGPNLSTPENAVKSYIGALGSKDINKIVKCIPKKCENTLRESEIEKLIKDYEVLDYVYKNRKMVVSGSVDPWADVVVDFERTYDQIGLIKETNGKWKITYIYVWGPNYICR